MEAVAASLLERDGALDAAPLAGALLFKRAEPPEAPYLNNVFQVLLKAPCRSLSEACVHAPRHMPRVAFPRAAARTFRLVVMENGVLKPLEERLMRELESLIARQSSMTVNRARPQAEVWLNVRSEGFYTLMLRLGKHKPFDKALAKGELRPDLCALLAALAHLKPHQRALDPFAGHGAIARALRSQCDNVTAGDMDEACVRYMRAHCPGVDVRRMDARSTGLPDRSVDAIVTDPPWGEYVSLPDARGLYTAFLCEASRILMRRGIVIVLSAQPVDAWVDASIFTTFIYPARVNGKQAGVFILERKE